ncbi:MAG: hypothetical protein ACXABK_05125 [Candidatus Heimdallarchaeaceae archaeon]|jgi:hypothetical protein
MQTRKIKRISDTLSVIQEKYPCYEYLIYFIQSEEFTLRKVGFSLVAPLFKQLPIEIQEFVRFNWEIESEKGKFPYSFVKVCNTIFSEEKNMT